MLSFNKSFIEDTFKKWLQKKTSWNHYYLVFAGVSVLFNVTFLMFCYNALKWFEKNYLPVPGAIVELQPDLAIFGQTPFAEYKKTKGASFSESKD